MQDLDHKHLIVTATLRSPPRNVEEVENWMRRVVDAVGMKILFGPNVVRCDTPGNEGVTGIVCIETSHASIHVWDTIEIPFMKFDLYSCMRFDPNIVTDLIKEFDPYYFQTMLIDRNNEIKVVATYDEQVASIINMLPDDLRAAYLESQRLPASEKTAIHRRARSVYNNLSNKFSLNAVKRLQRYKKEHRQTIASIRSRAKLNGLDFDLDEAWYTDELVKAKKKWPKLVEHLSEDAFWRAAVDRIDPKRGYTKDNCRIIPTALNVAKWKWSKDELATLHGLLAEELK